MNELKQDKHRFYLIINGATNYNIIAKEIIKIDIHEFCNKIIGVYHGMLDLYGSNRILFYTEIDARNALDWIDSILVMNALINC